jgi:uncharacterized protein DUF4345
MTSSTSSTTLATVPVAASVAVSVGVISGGVAVAVGVVVGIVAAAGDVIPGMEVFDLSGGVARTEVRAMYGGLQMAIGVFALVGAFRSKHRESAFLLFLLALTGLVLCRLSGMIAEGDSTYLSFSTVIAPGKYNQVGLGMYELPNCVLAWALFLLRPRGAKSAPELGQLRQIPGGAERK